MAETKTQTGKNRKRIIYEIELLELVVAVYKNKTISKSGMIKELETTIASLKEFIK